MAYDISSYNSVMEGVGYLYQVDNVSGSSIHEGFTFSHSYTFSGSVSISGSGSIDFIIGSVSATAGFTVGENVTNSVSENLSFNVPAHDWGFVQEMDDVVTTGGNFGTYEGGGANSLAGCPLANEKYVTTSLTRSNLQAYNVDATATSSTPPWPEYTG
jgi:hypothetical protein